MNRTAQKNGRLAKGIPKNFSADELAKRKARFGRAAALARWKNHKPKTIVQTKP